MSNKHSPLCDIQSDTLDELVNAVKEKATTRLAEHDEVDLVGLRNDVRSHELFDDTPAWSLKIINSHEKFSPKDVGRYESGCAIEEVTELGAAVVVQICIDELTEEGIYKPKKHRLTV